MPIQQVELTLRPDFVDIASTEDRDRLLTNLRERFDVAPDVRLTIVDSFPANDRLVVETEPALAAQIVEAVRRRALLREGIEDAFICPTAPADEDDLEFERLPMVKWFSPVELIRAGVKSLLSGLFGSYADRREMQALQAASRLAPPGNPPEQETSTEPSESKDPFQEMEERRPHLSAAFAREVIDLSDRDSLWIDYTADLGDGWNSTYTIARLLGESDLELPHGENVHHTKRGDVLIMGGDQVYPTATREEYQNRLIGPYRSALPCVVGEEAPKLFAIPGNHDWYDGLTSFTRLFCQQRWIGGWQTQQHRSYFAVKLPHDWWLWGIDVQLESDIDLPQFNYFESLARQITPGSKIILCSAEPSWIYAREIGAGAYQNFEYFERKIIRSNNLELVVGLAGDLHTYARYEEEPADGSRKQSNARSAPGPRQRLTAGGGGAYLYPSHQLPERLELPSGEPTADVHSNASRDTFKQKGIFPEKSDSWRMSFGALRLPFLNRSFALILGSVYLLFAWLMQSATTLPFTSVNQGESFLERLLRVEILTGEGILEIFLSFWIVLRHSPSTVVLVLLVTGGLIGFADMKVAWKRVALGVVHAGAHVVLALLLMWGFAAINLGWLELSVDDPAQVLLFLAEMLIIGSLLGGMLFGLYLLLSNLLLGVDGGDDTRAAGRRRARQKGVHANEVFSSQSIADYKNFVRFEIRENGDLVIYPVGIERVCDDWTFNASASAGRPWFDPAEGTISERAALIEEPVVVSS